AAGEHAATDPFAAFLRQLQGLPASMDARLPHALILWRTLLRLALKLIEQRAYVPAVMTNRDGATLIQWQPALLSPPLQDLLAQLDVLCPPDLVVLERKANRRRWHHYADARTQIFAALHLLLGFFIHRAHAKLKSTAAADVIKQVFFAGEPVHFERFETAEHPRLMHHWLRRLTLPERAHRLHVLVTEHGDDEFGVTLQVEQGDQFEPITDWLADTDAP